MICQKCFGTGLDLDNDCFCYRCEGQGEVPDKEKLVDEEYEIASDFDIDPDMGDH